jgi:hypothetical protein
MLRPRVRGSVSFDLRRCYVHPVKNRFRILLCIALGTASVALFYVAYCSFGMGHYIWTDAYHDNIEVHPDERGKLFYLRGLLFFSLPAIATFLPALLLGFIAFRLGLSVVRGPSARHARPLSGT